MTLIGIPYFQGENSEKFAVQVDAIYSEEFLSKIFETLAVSDAGKREGFADLLKRVSVSYLTAQDINSGRIQPHQQKAVFERYASALEETQRRYKEIQQHNSTSANFHDALKDLIRETKTNALKNMFEPYVSVGDGEVSLGSLSTGLFDEFLSALIEAANKAPDYIDAHDKADLSKEYILWWLHRISLNWYQFTEISFALGDWLTNDELKVVDNGSLKKKGIYKSTSLDVLYDLLSAVDENITRKDIETAMRKFKKI